MTATQLVLAFVLVQRGIELMIARRNAERLIDAGAVEHGAGHYPYLIVLHASWLAALVLTVPEDQPVAMGWLAVFGALTALRVWTMASLGRFWTTRILTLAGAPLVARGPYRFIRHPNYVVVAGEIAVVPMIFGAWWLAIIFSIANAMILRERIRVEDQALEARRLIVPES
jgi:methyltransferase